MGELRSLPLSLPSLPTLLSPHSAINHTPGIYTYSTSTWTLAEVFPGSYAPLALMDGDSQSTKMTKMTKSERQA